MEQRKTAEQYLEEDITARLQRIVLRLRARENHRKKLEAYNGLDSVPGSSRKEEIVAIANEIQMTEYDILSELIHLPDNIRKYYKRKGLPDSDLVIIERFRPFRIAANYVNVQKHGTRGRNQTNARIDFYGHLYLKSAENDPNPTDQLMDIQSMLNFDGKIYEVMDIADSLIRMWELFLRFHTAIKIDDFVSEIQPLMPQGLRWLSMAFTSAPDLVSDIAQKLDMERKSLNF